MRARGLDRTTGAAGGRDARAQSGVRQGRPVQPHPARGGDAGLGGAGGRARSTEPLRPRDRPAAAAARVQYWPGSAREPDGLSRPGARSAGAQAQDRYRRFSGGRSCRRSSLMSKPLFAPWPDGQQRLLLDAALAPGPRARGFRPLGWIGRSGSGDRLELGTALAAGIPEPLASRLRRPSHGPLEGGLSAGLAGDEPAPSHGAPLRSSDAPSRRSRPPPPQGSADRRRLLSQSCATRDERHRRMRTAEVRSRLPTGCSASRGGSPAPLCIRCPGTGMVSSIDTKSSDRSTCTGMC